MTDRLAAAAREVERVCGGPHEIVRVDVDDDGVLVLTAASAAGTRWFTSDERGLVERSPADDPRLPLARHMRARGGWQVLSYRPDRRIVLQEGEGERREVRKGHKKSRSARAVAKHLFAEGAMRSRAFRVPRLLRHDAEHEALVLEHLSGAVIELVAGSAVPYARLGERLAVFQDDARAGQLELFDVRDELAVLERWRLKVTSAVEALPDGWSEAHARLAQRAADLPAPRLGACHRDLHDRQVHLDGADVAVLDFDLLCRADVALDPANLVAHLRWRALQGLHGADDRSVRALEAAFLDGLGRRREHGFEARFAFYAASTLLRLALVYRLRPRWSPRVGELVALARSVLDDPVLLRTGARSE